MILAELALTPPYYLVLSALMFAVGATGLLIRRNPLVMFMCVELMLNGVNISCLLYTSPSPRDRQKSRMPSSA